MGNLTSNSNSPGAGSELLLRPATEEDAPAWDGFVERHPHARFAHLWGYRRVLEGAYGYRCAYLSIFAGDRRVGVFPSIVVRRGGARLISQPFIEYGGPLIEGLSTEQQKLLPSMLLRAAREHGCQSIEIRGGIGCEPMLESEYCVKHPLHSYAVLDLAPKEQLWRKALTNEARKGVNRAQKAGLTVDVRRSAAAVGDPFYDLYLISMKRLGVPPHSRQFFTQLAAGIGDHLVAAWVMDKAAPVAMLLGAVAGQRIQIFITASDPQAWASRPNDLAHWELIQWAFSTGLREFDFGSARYEGQIQFKKKWGVSLYEYGYYLIGEPNSAAIRQIHTVQTSSRLMTAMSSLWRTAVPTKVTGLLGPSLRKLLTK